MKGEELVLLSNAHRSYLAILERMQEGVVTTSTHGEVLYANGRFVEMTGVPRAQPLGRPVASFLEPEDAGTLRQLLDRSAFGNAEGEVQILHAGDPAAGPRDRQGDR